MAKARYHERPQSVSHPVWFGTGLTGVFHGDPDCPAIREKLDPSGPAFAFRLVWEIEPASNRAFLWRLDPSEGKGWLRGIEDPDKSWREMSTMNVDPQHWRPCLRCGSLRSDGRYVAKPQTSETQPCPLCHLTICDCHE